MLIAAGCCENSQAEYYEERTRLLEAGAQPVLIEAIEAQVGLATNQPKLKVFVISEHGELVRRLPTEYVDGRLLLFHRATTGVVSIHHVLSDTHIDMAVDKNKPRSLAEKLALFGGW